IDTSCDDTSAAVVEDGRKIVSNIVSSQSDIHSRYGGIVPELASRRHIEMIMPVVDEAIKQAGISLQDLSAVAVCKGPGLIGSLLIGCSFAKAVCYSRNIPLIAVNHLEGHLLSVFLQSPSPEFPFLSLIVSGGHTSLHIAEDYGRYIELGRTRDDAAGEAYDKVSKLLGLGYPGGPVIDRLAQKGDPMAIDFPRAYLPESFDFSFSGLKTAVLQFLRKEKLLDTPMPPESELLHNIASSFQAAVVDVLVRKTELAVKKTWIKQVTLSGGVSANSGLRKKMLETGQEQGFGVFVPPVSLCTDNAAMIAAAAHHRFIKKDFAGLDLNPGAYLSLSAEKM
ncbi:MAG: tRNA (adenosine(37)-N6)-threonylcarbamoyltransferase complex transferase subunit TsaD, partial [Thermodesulfovibrionales bacterium]